MCIRDSERLIADLGDNLAMILRNHGFLAAGGSVSEAFSVMFYLEKCAKSQIQALSAGGPDALIYPSDEVCEKSAQLFENALPVATRDWAGHLRRLDALDPSYRS